MKRPLFLVLFLLICATPTFATDITIPSFTIPNYTKSAAPKVRVYYSEGYFDSTGIFIAPGSPNSGSVYKVVNTTLLSGTVTVPAFTIPSTRDGIDSTTSLVSFYLYDGNAQISPNPLNAYLGMAVPATITSATGCSPAGTCATLAELKNLQAGLPPPPPPTYYTSAEVDRLFAALTVGVSVSVPVITKTVDTELTNEFALSTLATGILKNTTTTGIPTIAIAGTDYLAPSGSGAALTALNATQLTSGTVPDARFPATLPALSGVNLTALNATQLTSGTVPDARFPATLPALSGVNLTALNATNLASGAVPLARVTEVLALADLSDVTAKKGNSTIVQLQTGATATDDCAKFDSNGNIVSAGAPCGAGSGTGTVNTGVGGSLAVYPSNGTTVDDLTLGTANQVLGINSGATANEYKTLAVGSTGTAPNIAHAANSVTFHFPLMAASSVTSGMLSNTTQTLPGAKTFSTSVDAIIANVALASLPTPASSGRLLYLSDSLRGPAFDTSTNWYRANPAMNVQAWGAKFDGKLVGDASCTNTSTTITSGSAGFVATDVGKTFAADGCGAAGVTLTGTITAVGGVSSITVSVAASTTASPVNFYFATDDTAEIQDAIDDAPATGAILLLPPGKTIISATLTIGDGGATVSSLNNLHIKGAGGGRTQISFQGGATELWWVHGSSTNPMLKILGPYSNAEVSGIFFDAKVGPGGSASAVQSLWCHKCLFDDLSVVGHSGWALDFDTVASPVTGANVGGDDNTISNIWTGAPSANAGTEGGIRLGASDTTSGASSRNQLFNIAVYSSTHTSSAGISARFGDANSCYGCTTFVQGSAEGLLVTGAPSNSAYPSAMTFFNAAIQGGTRVSGVWSPLDKIQFWPYSVADAEPVPTDAGFSGVTSRNLFFGAFTFRDALTLTSNLTVGGTLGVTGASTFTGDVTLQDDLIFTGTAKRITGDFTNATHASRVLVQTSTADSVTSLGVMPSGSSTTGSFIAYNTSTPNTSGYIQTGITSSGGFVDVNVTGGATQQPFAFQIAGSNAFTVDTSRNIVATVSFTSPLIYGGSSAGSDLVIAGTSNGSPSGAHILAQTVSGATEVGGFLIGAPASTYLGAGDMLHLQGGDGSGAQITLDNYFTGSAVGQLVFRHARGTFASPTATAADDLIASISGRGYQTTTGAFTGSRANIAFAAAEAFTSTAQGTYITVATTPIGSATAREVARFNAAGIFNSFKGADVASAAAIVPTGNTFHVTGTTNITSITSTGVVAGTRITIIFDGVLTFTDGSNLVLAGNFVTTASDTITLVYDGTSWHEVARAVN